jgi:hypothetical protein
MTARRLKSLTILALAGSVAFAPAAGAADTVVRHFTAGIAPDKVGIVPGSLDTETSVPQAIYAGEDGKIYLLDQVNGRVLNFDPKQPNATPAALQLPENLQPTDLVVQKGDILVWDGNVHRLHATGPEGESTRGLEELRTRGLEDRTVVSAFAQMGSQSPPDDTDLLNEGRTRALTTDLGGGQIRQYISTKGRGVVTATVVRSKDNTSAEIEVSQQYQDGSVKLHLKVRDRLGAVEFLEVDKQGRMFIMAENIPPTSDDPASAFVARYAPNGRLDGIFELPLSKSVALSRRFVTISENGDVYFLRTQQASVDVVGVGFRPLRNAQVIDVGGARPEGLFRMRGKGAIAAVRPLTRQSVIETAFAFESIRWKVTPANYGSDPDTVCTGFQRVRRPGYLHGKLGQMARGIPYCWGCHGSLSQIRAKFDRGILAGNVCTRNNPRTDVAGVDCSAFVSAAWGLAQHFTTIAIPTIAKPLSNAWDMLPGDALNKPGSHVVLFLRFTPDKKVEVMEASPGACNGRVCRNVYPLSALLARGFVPVRFKGLANDMTAKVSIKSDEDEAKAKSTKHHREASQSRTHRRRKR